ncbi:MAG TPA: hypothetical protein VI864_06990 [Candidatus Bathyarchaeia archaeon]|nr:hypothetical protein [Candidatus Bathyarchaeia archaeon]
MNEDQPALHEQVFLLFYAAIIGIVAGVWGNLWATLFFEYVIKSDTSLVLYFWIATIILIVIVAILVWAMVKYRNKLREAYALLLK